MIFSDSRSGIILPVLVAATLLGAAVLAAGRAEPNPAPYVVDMSPMGPVRFNHVPKRVVTLDANYNDILVALGEGGKLIATGYRGNSYDGFYKLLGIPLQFNTERLAYLSSGGGGMFDKELLYSLHGDIHHIDPVQLASNRGWSKADVDEIARNVGPFFANRYSRDNSYGGKEPYKYYSVWELSEKVGEVYRQSSKIERLRAVYDDMLAYITKRLPPVEKRPRIGLIFYNGDSGRFTPYSLQHGGFGQAQYRDVGARDAFASIEKNTYHGEGGRGALLDAEGLLALDPDLLIMPFAIYPANQATTSRASYDRLMKLKDDPLMSRLTAFRTGRVFPGGTPLQGPIFYLFQIEMAAKQIYPGIFGPYRDDQNYPVNERLFDRGRVAAILNVQERSER